MWDAKRNSKLAITEADPVELDEFNTFRADPRHAPSQWETPLQSYDVWLGANLESTLSHFNNTCQVRFNVYKR